MPEKIRVLFLCTGNSCRSQMAEGFTRALKGDIIEAWSAGVAAAPAIDPRAVSAMREAGIDLSGQKPKLVTDLPDIPFDYVVTLCDHAAEACPFFPAKTRVLHAGFQDPPVLARGAATDEEAMSHYRRVRDEIRAFVESLPEALSETAP